MGQARIVARRQPLILVPAVASWRAEEAAFSPAPNLTIVHGTVLGQITNSVNDVDTVTMTGTGGDWAITIQNNDGTYTASNLAYNISLANLQTALMNLPNIGYTESGGVQTANVTVTGTAGSSYVITGANQLAGLPIGIVTVDATNGGSNGLTGGTVTVAHTTTNDKAGQIKAYASGNSDGSQNPVGIAKVSFTTDQNGNITIGGAETNFLGSFTGPTFGLNMGSTNTIPAYISGPFWESDLTGLDSTAITAFKGRTFQAYRGSTADTLLRIP